MKKNYTRQNIATTMWAVVVTFLLASIGYAQDVKNITGTVITSDKEPLPGVSIKVKGGLNAAVTDIKGKFYINAKTGDVLTLSFIGFNTKEVTVTNNVDLGTLILTESMASLKEVQVVSIGYGTQRRPDLTGSISSVTGADLTETQPTTLDQALQGKVAGVVVQQVSGQPGGGVSVQIRGLQNFAGTPPLYVIDGVQIPPNGQSPLNGNGSNPLASLNPSDIASIDILKDASATAIYGSQASAGVIIITTKRGKTGRPLISYDGYGGVQTLPKYYDVMNLPQYATFMNQKSAIIGYDLRPQFANPQYLGQGTNWQKALYRVAPQQNHNLAVSGGDDVTKYYLSGTYFTQEGIALGSDFKRASVKLNIDNRTTNWLKVGISVSLNHTSENVSTSNTGVILQALNQTPDVEAVNPDGTYGGNDPNIYGAYGVNPFAIATLVKDLKTRYQGIGNAYADIQFTNSLSLRNEVSGNFDFANEDYFNPKYTMGAYTHNNNTGTTSNGQNFYKSITNYLTYSKQFGKLYYVNAVAGHEAQLSNNSFISATRTNFASDNVQTISSGDPTTATNAGTQGYGALEAYFGRLNLTVNHKYLLTGTVRRDGSSKFAPDLRYNTTASGAFAWRITDEGFMKSFKKINDLKLRLGYGLVNNQNINEYAYGSTLNTVATGLSGNSQLTATTGNPNVKWETTKSYNIGLDAAILDSRISFSVDAYNKTTNGLLLSLNEPFYSGTYPSGGYSPGAILAPFVNIGSVSNKGIEFSISTDNIRSKNFNWKTNIIFSHNDNKVLALADGTPALYGTYSKTVVGRSIGEFFGYQTLGLYKNAADFKAYPALRQNGTGPLPVTPGSGGVWVGDVIFKDVNNDGKIDANDQTYLGSPVPKVQFGFNNTFNYKNLDLTIFLTGNYGNKIFNQLKVNGNDPNQNFGYFPAVLNYAQIGLINPTGSTTDINNVYITNPGTNITRISQNSGDQNTAFSDRYIEDGSFIKCKSIALGYNFSSGLISRIHLKSLRLYANVTNVFTITRYTGYDPEIGSYNPLQAGIDNGYYAQARVFTMGINISLNN
jgi:TonB-linked SusC/RagA family outer membrane protein